MKKSIVFFLREFPVYSQTFVVEQINGMIEQGHDVKIVSLYEGRTEMWEHFSLSKNKLQQKSTFLLTGKFRKRGKNKRIISVLLKILFLPLTNLAAFRLLLPKLIRLQKSGGVLLLDELLTISRLPSKNKIHNDVMIAHFGDIGVEACLLSKCGLFNGQLFTVFHGYELSEFKFVDKWSHWYVWLSKNSHQLLPISDKWKNKLESLGIEKGKATVVHMGIDLSKFAFKPKSYLDKPIKLLTVGRAVEKKGIEYAINGVIKSSVDVEYHIIGDGPLISNLKKITANPKLKNKFVFHGEKPSDFVQSKLQESDIFILTSVQSKTGDMEGIPVSLMEAMASGTLVISTLHSGIPELIENNKSGILVNERDSEAIAIAINQIANIGSINAMQNAAFNKVNNEFNQLTINKQLSKLVERTNPHKK